MDLKNKLIVFEGGDVSGKSSIAKRLVKDLNDEGIASIFTFQPGDTKWGTNATLMRSLCKDKRHNLHPLSNFFAFLLDRVEVTDKVVSPSLDQGNTVVSDRWNYSTIAYQLYGKRLIEHYDMPESVLTWLNDLAIRTSRPDVVVYFPEKLDVWRAKDENDQFENTEDSFMDRVHKAYESMAHQYGWLRIYPESTEEATYQKVRTLLDEYEKPESSKREYIHEGNQLGEGFPAPQHQTEGWKW